MRSNVLDHLLCHERVNAANATARERPQAGAPSSQPCQGGSTEVTLKRNQKLYEITVGENAEYRIPVSDFRGHPTGIDVRAVLASGVPPVVDVGLVGREAGQTGASFLRALLDCFASAAQAPAARAA